MGGDLFPGESRGVLAERRHFIGEFEIHGIDES
jgi:hypothetical protein